MWNNDDGRGISNIRIQSLRFSGNAFRLWCRDTNLSDILCDVICDVRSLFINVISKNYHFELCLQNFLFLFQSKFKVYYSVVFEKIDHFTLYIRDFSAF